MTPVFAGAPAVGEDAGEAPKRLYLIEAAQAGDALLRILEPFAHCQATLADVSCRAAQGAVRVRIEAEGLTDARAETLRRKLARLPAVTSVGMGWRGG